MVRVVLPLKLTPESETHFHWFLKPCKTLENPWLSLHSGQNPPTNSVEEANLLAVPDVQEASFRITVFTDVFLGAREHFPARHIDVGMAVEPEQAGLPANFFGAHL